MTWFQSQCLQLIFSKLEIFLLNFDQLQCCSMFFRFLQCWWLWDVKKQREPQGPWPTSLQGILCYSHNAIAEIALEGLGLVSLHFPVLHGAPPECVVQLGDVQSRGTLLILRWIIPNPVMQIHSGAARGSFGLGEVGKMSQDEDVKMFQTIWLAGDTR